MTTRLHILHVQSVTQAGLSTQSLITPMAHRPNTLFVLYKSSLPRHHLGFFNTLHSKTVLTGLSFQLVMSPIGLIIDAKHKFRGSGLSLVRMEDSRVVD